jgi:hypothetical protein
VYNPGNENLYKMLIAALFIIAKKLATTQIGQTKNKVQPYNGI